MAEAAPWFLKNLSMSLNCFFYCLDFIFEFVIITYMRKIELKNVIWKEGKYYISLNLNTDISSFGSTKKEALANLDEALELYFEYAKKRSIVKIERPELVNLSLRHA